MINVNAFGKRVKLGANGSYRIFPDNEESFSSISALWLGEGVRPGGTLTFSLDGDPGHNSELGVINLAQAGQPGSRSCAANMSFAFVDVTVAALPPDGQVMLYLR